MPNSDTKPVVLIEGWQLLVLHGRPFHLTGFVTGHPRLPGFRRRVRTSLLITFDEAAGLAETVNTLYQLQHPIRDTVFHPDGTVAKLVLGDFTADRVLDGRDWLVLRGPEPVGSFHTPDPVDVILRLLALATASG